MLRVSIMIQNKGKSLSQHILLQIRLGEKYKIEIQIFFFNASNCAGPSIFADFLKGKNSNILP